MGRVATRNSEEGWGGGILLLLEDMIAKILLFAKCWRQPYLAVVGWKAKGMARQKVGRFTWTFSVPKD
jgi:hypothetical protein